MEDNIKRLLERLGNIGVCKTGQRYLSGTSQDFNTLVKVWRGWPEYFYEHSDIALKFMRDYLTGEDKIKLANENLFVDYSGLITAPSETPVFVIGCSNIEINSDDYTVLKIYAFNNSSVEVNMSKNVIANIEAWNNSSITVNNAERGRCTVYQYDGAIVIGDARIVRRQYKRGEVFNGREMR